MTDRDKYALIFRGMIYCYVGALLVGICTQMVFHLGGAGSAIEGPAGNLLAGLIMAWCAAVTAAGPGLAVAVWAKSKLKFEREEYS